MRGAPYILMYQSLIIENSLLADISTTFSNSLQEEGFLLGCSSAMNRITHAEHLNPVRAGRYYYVPDSQKANEIIRRWAMHGICFCGFIHSHVTDKEELSEADLLFAEALIRAYRIPVLWFGLAVIIGSNISFRFYSVIEKDGNICISPILFDHQHLGDDFNESLYR